MIKFSILIPTIGRKSLVRSISSAKVQIHDDTEILIIYSCKREQLPMEVLNDSRVKLIENKSGGISSNRNAGIQKAAGDWIIFMDDDDCFTSNSFSEIRYKTSESRSGVLIFQSIFINRNSIKIKYSNSPNQKKFVNDLFPLSWKVMKSGFATPSIVVRKEVCTNIKFSEKFKLKEDIVWLLQLHKYGVLFEQISAPTAIIFQERKRSYLNENLKSFFNFTWFLLRYDVRFGLKYFFGVGARVQILRFFYLLDNYVLKKITLNIKNKK